MPRLQRLINQYKNAPDIQFLTLNTDEDPGLIGQFMQKYKFTFTVLAAYGYTSDTLKVMFIPQNWVVDSTGTVRLEALGYDSTDPYDKWQKAMTAAIQRYAPPENVRGSAGPSI